MILKQNLIMFQEIKTFFRNKEVLIYLVILAGLVFRFYFATFQSNYDFESYKIVISLLEKGKNVYAETNRYNYGPIWFGILWILNNLASLFNNYDLALRFLVCFVLSSADLGVFLILLKKYDLTTAAVFFLNPLSIFVTGFHQQFDTLAIFFGLLGIFLYSSRNKKESKKYLGLFLVGISLIAKHLLIFFPFWIFFSESNKKWKFLSIIIPYGMFFLSFVPFIQNGGQGILENVFFYKSLSNAPFYYDFIPQFFGKLLNPLYFFIFIMILLGYLLRKRNIWDSFMIYLLSLLTFSPAVFYNYLSWVLVPISVLWNKWFLTFTIVGTYIYLLDGYGLGIKFLIDNAPPQLLYGYYGSRIFDIPILILFCGCIWLFYDKKILGFFRDFKKRFNLK